MLTYISNSSEYSRNTVKILKIGTPEIITIIVLQLEQLDCTVQYCVQKMQTEHQTEKTLIRLLHEEQSDLGLHCLLRLTVPIFKIITVGFSFSGALATDTTSGYIGHWA